MSLVSSFKNYSQNQFLFLSANGSNITKENNHNFQQSDRDYHKSYGDDSFDITAVKSETVQDESIVVVSSSESENLPESVAFTNENIFIDEEVLNKNNPFWQVVVPDENISDISVEDTDNKVKVNSFLF